MFNKESMSELWELKEIKDSCELIMGQSPPGSSYNEKGEGMPFLQGKAEFGKTFPSHVKFTTDPKRKVKKGSILMSVRAPVGDVNIANINYCIGRGLASLNLKNGDNKYLFYLLNYLKPKIQESGTGSTFKAITKSGLEKIKIPVPPLEDQKKIVEILEKAEKLKEWRAKADELADEYLKSIFQEMFGDPGKNPKNWDVAKIQNVVQKTKNENPEKDYPDESFYYIDISSIDSKIGKITSYSEFLGENAPSRARQKVETKDLLVSTVRPNLNAVALVSHKLNNQIASTGFCVLRPSEKISPEYLFYISRSKYFVESLINQCKGASYPAVNNSDILSLKIPIPLIAIQNQFAQIVQQVETLKTHQSQSKQEIDNLFNTLMQKAFKGDLYARFRPQIKD